MLQTLTLLKGLYVVTDMYPVHLQARKVRTHFCAQAVAHNELSSASGQWGSYFPPS